MLLTILGIVVAILTLPGTIELAWLTIGGLLPPRPLRSQRPPPQHIAVVIPAHNEEASIARCVAGLLACDRPKATFSLYVIADNCTDATATEAKNAGAHVIVRQNEQQRGKGYALDYAFNLLLPQGIEAVLIVDADTLVEHNFLQACEHCFTTGAEALQCRYTVNNTDSSLRTRLMNIALLAFNVLRPRGRNFWGLSVGIAGNGFGLTKTALERVPYTARSVVEDLEYHLALVRAGLRVHFVDTTTVRGDMPMSKQGVDTQRARWEGGRLRMMREHIPILFKAVLNGQTNLIEPLFELLLLPLALHVLLLLITLMIPVFLTQQYALLALSIVIIHVLAGLWVGKASIKDIMALATVPFYIIWKLTQIPRLLKTARKDAHWERTDREQMK